MKTAVEWLVEELPKGDFDQQQIAIKQAIKMEKQQQDEFTLGFAKWLDNKYYQGKNVNEYHRSIDEYREGKYFTAKELLEIYKKEKGL